MKKIISLILAVLLVFSCSSVCLAAEEEYPTIYVVGTAEEIYDEKGEQVYPIGLDIGGTFTQALKPCLEKLLEGLITGDYEPYAQEFYDAFVPYFSEAILDKNGEVTNGTHMEKNVYDMDVMVKHGNYGFWDYGFWYDWRTSPLDIADELEYYIDRVTKATGKDKVNIISRCYGSNVVAAYLEKYQDHALENVNAVTYYTASVKGIDFLSALFSGEICLEGDAIDNFADYFLNNNDIIPDETTRTLVLSLIELLNQVRVLGIATDGVEILVDEVKHALIPKIVRDSFGGWLSHWAMVTPELYEQARDFVFGGYEQEYAGFIAKADAYYEQVQLNFDQTTKRLESQGIKFYNITKYNFPCYPIFKGATAQSDAYTTVEVQSFGATSAPYGEVLSEKYISGIENTKYLSPDRIIDASTCLLPDTTWFIKDIYHDNFDDVVHFMIMDIMRNDITADDGKYAQFLQYTPGKLTAIESVSDSDLPAADNSLVSLMRFLTAIMNFFVRLFKGELKFGE